MKTFKAHDNIKFCPQVTPYDSSDKASVRHAMLGARQSLDASSLQRAEEMLASRVLAYIEGRLAKASPTLAGRTSAAADACGATSRDLASEPDVSCGTAACCLASEPDVSCGAAACCLASEPGISCGDVIDARASGASDATSLGSSFTGVAASDTLSCACIMSYMSYRNEFPTHILNSKLLSASCNLVLPFTDADFDITAYHVRDMSELVTSRLGIIEPDTELCHAAEPDAVDIILMPGVAFDASGNRIGFGKGCYDRFITQCRRRPLIIALAYDFQVIESLPSDPHDIPADVIITEAHIYEPGL